MAVKIDVGDDNPAAAPCGVAGEVVCGIFASLFCVVFLSAGQCAIGNGDSFVPHASVARNGSTSNADRRICDFYDTAGGRRRGSTSGTGGSNASAGMVHIRCQTRIARLWNFLNKSNALIVERILYLLDYEGVSFRRNVIVIGRWCPNQTLSGYAEKWSKVHTEFRQSKT